MTTVTTVPFGRLIAADAINARAATKDGLDELAASIAARGLIQPLAVRPADGDRYEVIDGRRRHAAIAKLVRSKAWKKDAEIPVLVRNEDDSEALETSLVANTVRLPMHPVDQHEVFARLAEQGRSTAEIATRFGLADRTVRQHLALGRLHPDVRAAWRKGKIDAETARAFALSEDQAAQAACLAEAGRQPREYDVRRMLSTQRARLDQSDEIALVGEAAYLAAGGRITEDLFDDARYVDDVPFAKRLARERLQAECDKLLRAGWSWALIEGDDEDHGLAEWQCDHVRGDDADPDLPPADYKPAERKRSGCLVTIRHKGEIEIYAGLIKPEPRQTDIEDLADDDDGEPGPLPGACGPDAQWASEGPEDKDDPYAISSALTETITTSQTVAAAAVLREDPGLALRAIVAALGSMPWSSPVKVSIGGQAAAQRRDPPDFVQRFRQISAWPAVVVQQELAELAAAALQLLAHNAGRERPGEQVLVDALDPAAYLDEMRRSFVAPDYFQRATKATALEALDEMRAGGWGDGLAPAGELAAMKKGDLATIAGERARESGWLPPQVRHRDYALIERSPPKLRGKTAAAEQTDDADAAGVTAPRGRRARR